MSPSRGGQKVAQGRLTEILPCVKCEVQSFGNLSRRKLMECINNGDSGPRCLVGWGTGARERS